MKKETNLVNYQEDITKLYNSIKTGMTLTEVKEKLACNDVELEGIFALLKMNDKELFFEKRDEDIIVIKNTRRKMSSLNIKNRVGNTYLTKLIVVSDMHLGNNGQQLHLLNKAYKMGKDLGVDAFVCVGDCVDGDYSAIRKEQDRQIFLHGFDEQCGYFIDMYPKVEGIPTYYILGSHDETHYKNNKATIDYWTSRERNDMVFLGQDVGYLEINNLKITLDHPGDGSARSLSYKPQQRIELLETGFKPSILLIGHYHKQYYFVYRNVRGLEIPCLCAKTQFQQKKGLTNYIGYYLLNILSDELGHVQQFSAKPILYGKEDLWEEAGKDARKVKRLSL